MIAEEVAERIQDLLGQRGMTIYMLADKCSNVSQSTVYNAASGDKKNLTLETLSLICEGLNVSVNEFFNYGPKTDMVLSDEEKLLIERVRKMNDRQRDRLNGYIQSLVESNN